MSEIISETLYRKYRPATFDDVLGQEEVVSVLQNSIQNKSISHSYLFSGTRGTGKTSVARIFAAELETSPEDIYEIDAASNRGINEIRELRAGVDTRPFNSPYKVYIIDEVHMLTKEAANALLKTLEEPPSHVLFILATTEKHKILDTIISRCQVFDFKRPRKDLLIELVHKIAKEEKRNIDDESAAYIAELGNGSYRDTLSHLQSVFSFFPKDITFAELSQTRTLPQVVLTDAFLKALNDSDREEIFDVYHTAQENHLDIRDFVQDILMGVRMCLLFRYSPSYKKHKLEVVGQERIDTLESYTNINSGHLQGLLDVVSKFEHADPAIVFEIYLFELFSEDEK